MRVGLYLPGASGPTTGVWTRLKELAAGLEVQPSVQLFVASQSLEAAADLGVGGQNVYLLPAGGRAKLAAQTSRHVRRFVAAFGLDVVQIEAPPVPRNVGCPVVFSLHDLRQFDSRVRELRSLGDFYIRFKLARDLRGVDAVLALSAWAANDLSTRLHLARERIHVIAPVAPQPPSESPAEPASSGHNRFVVAVGHLEPRKNLEVLVRATYEPDWPSDTALVLAGKDQGSEATLRSAAARSPVPIEFVGTVTEERKWWLLRNAFAVAVPSRLEGFGIVALEGIVAGTPVLVANSTALPEVARAPDSILATDSPPAWSERVAELATSASARCRIADAQAAILPDHSSEVVTLRLLAVYRHLLSPVPRLTTDGSDGPGRLEL